MRAKTYPNKWFKNGQSDIMTHFGAPAEELYLPGVPASGNITGSIAGNVLTPVLTPKYQQALTSLPGDPLGAGFDIGTQDSFDGDYHAFTTSFAILVPFSGTNPDAQYRAVLGRRVGSGGLGYELIVRDDSLIGVADNGAQLLATAAGDYSSGLHYGFFGVSLTTAILYAYSDLGSGQSGATATSVLTGGTFSLGQSAHRLAPGLTIGPVIIWSGAAAETVIANRATTLPAWWAL